MLAYDEGWFMSDITTVSRPRSVGEWKERLQRLLLPVISESIRQGLSYRPAPTDVFISPYHKCGTTWLQQIVHTLRTRGDMAFDDISRVIPWLENAQAQGIDIAAPQRGSFHAFKSHLAWDLIPKGGRYIVAIRDPKDALVSLYRFFDGWQFERGTVSIEQFFDEFYASRDRQNSYWNHLISWWPHRNDNDVLLLCYEDMKNDLDSAIKQIASFLEIPLDEGLMEITSRHAALDFMQAHKDKFDELITCELNVKLGLLPPGGDSSKVKTGRVGDHKQMLPERVNKEMDLIWEKEIKTKLGVPSYQAMRGLLFAC
jgi:hypothetical protein